MDWVLWFFSETIYGIAVVAAPIYGVFWLLRRIWPRLPHPGVPTAVFALAALFSVSSIPRYTFEATALENVKLAKHMKLVATSKWGSITEPITWFHEPIGFFRLVGPSSGVGEVYDHNSERNSFTSVVLRYGEDKQLIQHADADCSDKTVWYSQPDENGILRYATNSAVTMNEKDHEIFCETDYSEEQAYIRKKQLEYIEELQKNSDGG
jgi:hypothetical protein